MKLLLILLLGPAMLGAALLPASPAGAQSLIAATNSAEAAAVIRDAGADQADLIRNAIGLGVADPVELVFALVTPASSAAETNRIANALTSAAPRRADEIAASTAIAADVSGDEARLVGLIRALMQALNVAALNDEAREEEKREVLAALLSVTNPELRLALADAIAGGDGAALLAAIGDGPETAAITPPPRPFGEPPIGLTLTPGSAAQDAPSAN